MELLGEVGGGGKVLLMAAAVGTKLEQAPEPWWSTHIVGPEFLMQSGSRVQYQVFNIDAAGPGTCFENRCAVGSWRTEFLTPPRGQEGFPKVGVFQLSLGRIGFS